MTALQAGTRLDRENFIHVPPGSIIDSGSGRRGIVHNGYCLMEDTGSYSLYTLSGYRVVEVGDWDPEPETAFTFVQRAYTVCYGSASDSGVPLGPVIRGLERIGASNNPELGVGMWVHFGDVDLLHRLRQKQGVVVGFGNPNHWEAYGEVDPIHLRVLKGGGRAVPRTLRVLAMTNPDTERYLIPPTAEDEAEIARLRGIIWSVGAEAKTANRWCEAYEQAVGTLGVSAALAHTVTGTPRREPDGLPMIEASELCERFPIGAVFEYSSNNDDRPDYDTSDDWNWTRRVGGREAFGGMRYTQNYIGPNSGHWGGRRRVLWDGTGEMCIPVTLPLMQYLPVGTRLGYREDRDTHYVKVEGGAWQTTGGAIANDQDFFGRAQQENGTPATAWFIHSLPDL